MPRSRWYLTHLHQYGRGGHDPLSYCGTQFRFDPQLTPLDADPPDSFFADDIAT